MTPREHAKGPLANRRAAEMAEYVDGHLHMAHYDESTFARSLLLVAELHGVSLVAQQCASAASPCDGS